MALRIIFCGTPTFAVPSLRRLIAEKGFELLAVVTQPDRPSGRGRVVGIPPVKEVAIEEGLAIFQPQSLRRPESLDFFESARPDAVAIIAFGQIVPQRLIDIPRLGWINVHASLLPKYRGAAPINWAIANGEARTGLTTMQIDAGLDTGPMLLKWETEIGADETAPQLSTRLAEAGAPLIVETLRSLDRGEIRATPQDHTQATQAPILKKEDGRIDWTRSAREIYNRMRGLDPWPGAFTLFRGKMCHVWGRPAAGEAASAATGQPGTIAVRDGELLVACGEGVMGVEFAQLEGRKRITAREFANGAHPTPGERFGA
jgi:methionyl-tRNA formyltransferase